MLFSNSPLKYSGNGHSHFYILKKILKIYVAFPFSSSIKEGCGSCRYLKYLFFSLSGLDVQWVIGQISRSYAPFFQRIFHPLLFFGDRFFSR